MHFQTRRLWRNCPHDEPNGLTEVLSHSSMLLCSQMSLFVLVLTVGFDLPTDPRVRNGKRRISRTGSRSILSFRSPPSLALVRNKKLTSRWRNRSSYIRSILLFNGQRSVFLCWLHGYGSLLRCCCFSQSLIILKKEWIERKAPGFLSLGVNIEMGAVWMDAFFPCWISQVSSLSFMRDSLLMQGIRAGSLLLRHWRELSMAGSSKPGALFSSSFPWLERHSLAYPEWDWEFYFLYDLSLAPYTKLNLLHARIRIQSWLLLILDSTGKRDSLTS